MGCDIHAHLEVKIKNEWHYFSQVPFQRSYGLFAKMAGVRDFEDGPIPISVPRGLPNDVSFLTNFYSEYWGSSGHSHSWLCFDELVDLLDFADNDLKCRPWGFCTCGDANKWVDFGVWLFGNCIGNFKKYPEDYPAELEDIRLIFWFDS